MDSLYGPKPKQCPARFEHCGDCNIHPCHLGQGPTPADCPRCGDKLKYKSLPLYEGDVSLGVSYSWCECPSCKYDSRYDKDTIEETHDQRSNF